MGTLDYFVLLPIAFFAYRGFKNGLVKEVSGIIGLILAVFFTFNFMEDAGRILAKFLTISEEFLPFAGAISVFILTIVLVQVAVWLINSILDAAFLSLPNKIAGAVFGSLKVGIIISAILLLLAGFNQPNEETRKASATYKYAIQLAPMAYNTIAAIYPGAESFSVTINKTIQSQKRDILDQYIN